jgi:WD40 repeat protein
LDYWIINLAAQFQVDRNTVYKNLITNTKKSPVDDAYLGNIMRKPLQGHTDWVRSVCAAGNKIISGSRDKTIRVWDMDTGECLRTLQGHTSSVYGLCTLCTVGNKIISASEDKTIRIWDRAL